MKRRTISARPVALLATLALASVAAAQNSEQRVAELVEELGNGSKRASAREQLLKLGEDFVPVFVRALRDEGPETRELIRILGDLGPAAVEAFYPLLDVLEKGSLNLWCDAAVAAAEIAPYTKDPTEETIKYVWTLTTRPIQGGVSVNEIQRAFNRFTARMNVTVDSSESIDNLIHQLEESDRFTKEVIAEILMRRSSEARAATPVLASLLEQGDRGNGLVDFFFVEKATRLLVEIAPHDSRTWIAYKYMLEVGTIEDRRRAVVGLSRLGPAGIEKAFPQLRKALESSEDTALMREAITALGMIGPAARQAIPTLEKLSEHDDPQIAERARAALRQIRRTLTRPTDLSAEVISRIRHPGLACYLRPGP